MKRPRGSNSKGSLHLPIIGRLLSVGAMRRVGGDWSVARRRGPPPPCPTCDDAVEASRQSSACPWPRGAIGR